MALLPIRRARELARDGVLTLVVPKKPEVQPKRIKLGGGEAKTQGQA